MATIPSIAMIPSGVKASKLYSVLPTNGAGDFTTTRASVATRVNENGLIEEVASNVPRLDYSDGGCPSLLLEGTSTNLISYSEAFDNAYWTKAGSSVVGGQLSPSANSPLGAFKLIEDTSTGQHQIYSSGIGVTPLSDYSYSLRIKTNGRQWVAIGNNVGEVTYFDLINGVIGTSTMTSTKITALENGFYDCSVSFDEDNSSDSLRVYLADANNSLSYTGDGTSGVYIFGAQLEENPYATSYIKTEGTTQTRVADTAYKTSLTNLIGQSEGVLFVDFIPKDNTDTQIVYQVRTSGVTNVGQIDIRLQSGNINALGNDGGSSQFFIAGTSFNLGQRYKCAVRYKENDVAFYINGVLIGTDLNSSFSSSSKDQVSFGENLSSLVARAGIKDARVYTTVLSDAELTSLTTI